MSFIIETQGEANDRQYWNHVKRLYIYPPPLILISDCLVCKCTGNFKITANTRMF